jgi:hypothetical protein
MFQAPTLTRWRAALTQAARHILGARWCSTLEALEAARIMLAGARLRHIASTKWGRRSLAMELLLNPAKQEAAA